MVRTFRVRGVVAGKKSAEQMLGLRNLQIVEVSRSTIDTIYALVDADRNEVGRVMEARTGEAKMVLK